MKVFAKTAVLLSALALAVSVLALTAACATRPPPGAGNVGAVDFSLALDRDWFLAEVRTGTETIFLDREKLEEEGFDDDIFSLRFENGQFFGVAMPNVFRGPYTTADDRAITFGPAATTMMLAFREPEELSEHEFFVFLNNVFGWDLAEGDLELHTTCRDGTETVLVFVLAN